MAFPASFLRHTLIWTLPDGETAMSSCSWRPSSPLVSLDSATVDALALKGTTLWAGIKDRYASNLSYVGSKVYWIGPDGRTLDSAERQITAVPGTGTSTSLPTEVAVVASLRTGSSARRARGRMFLPGPDTSTVTNAGRLGVLQRDDIAAQMASYLGDVVVGGVTYDSVVASATYGVFTSVTQVRVGDVFDVQRRRRDRLVESYKTEAV